MRRPIFGSNLATDWMKLPFIGHTIQEFKILNSTNLYATVQIREGEAVHGMVIRADEQTEGRGQRGRKWVSAPGDSILMSVVLDPSKLVSSQHFRLVAAMALGTHDYLQSLHADGWKIKWPNDLYWNDRKAGGILIENIYMAGKWAWSVAGIGINLNMNSFDPLLPNPVSVSHITGKQYKPSSECRLLCAFLEERWQQLRRPGGWWSMLDEYNSKLFARGNRQRFRKQNMVADLLVHRVTSEGKLVAGDAGEYLFDHGEIQWILPEN